MTTTTTDTLTPEMRSTTSVDGLEVETLPSMQEVVSAVEANSCQLCLGKNLRYAASPTGHPRPGRYELFSGGLARAGRDAAGGRAMFTLIVVAFAHVVATGLPVTAALWGMVAVACCYEWRRYLLLARGTRLAPASAQWLVIEHGRAEYIESIRCQELVIRRYSH